MTAARESLSREARSFQPWMFANFAVGAAFSAFIALLIPPYVTDVTGDVAASGVVMAVISLAAVLGPVLGTFADRYRAHRLVMSGGVLGAAVGFAAFAISAQSSAFYALDAIVLGVSIAAISAVGPVFIVGAGLGRVLEARRMTVFSLAMPAGQVAGGVAIGIAAEAGWSYSDRFWLAAVFMAVVFIVVWFTSKEPERRLHASIDAALGGEGEAGAGRRIPLKAVIVSSFGVFLLISIFSSIANNGINNQISNILPNVYGISQAGTSTLVSVAGLLNIVVFFPAGRWMARSGAMTVYGAGLTLRLFGAFGMAIAGLLAGSPQLIAIASMQLLYQGSPFARLAQPSTAMRFAKFPAGAANGWLIAASALGSCFGSILGGVFAEQWGFNSVNWMGAGAAAVSVVLFVFVLVPRDRGGARPQIDSLEPGSAAKGAIA